MTKDKGPVRAFEESKQRVVDYFGCEGDFFLKLMPELEWALRTDDDFTFLSYWTKEGSRADAVVVRKSGTPMVYEREEYTMVVAIDCVKIGFIFQNGTRRSAE